ncbi:hypothetical protein K435DRAFT_791673 [Dendrothele bispora CBS 962.96]|uniref:Uncharacterized protein n=1 Tax=Dendrothele bispora (strain CBS 962.96) TaxID=1314807 RepID=A0A4S8MMH4_DENBC|nr:hypothetical protein K435DRAFT_791673 [Dendrothele bispora CBS 962.96]
MWSRFTSLVKHRNEEHSEITNMGNSLSSGQVLDGVRDVHPNLSVFHSDSDNPVSLTSPPASPSKSRRNLFKRNSRMPPPRDEDMRAPSPAPSQLSIGKPKKKRSSNQLHLTQSLGRSATPEPSLSSPLSARRPSLDALRSPHFNSVRSVADVPRPSLDVLREDDILPPSTPSAVPPGSVRSILRDPKTPGTGSNVRFFSRQAFGEQITDQSQSTEIDFQSIPPPFSTESSRQVASMSAIVTRTSPKNSRPSLGEIFSPLDDQSRSQSLSGQVNNEANTPLKQEIPPSDTSHSLDLSQDIELPSLPPGLHLDLDIDSGLDLPVSDEDNMLGPRHNGPVFTSTPFRDKGKGKERAIDDIAPPKKDAFDETIFHAKEKSPKLPHSLHDRSNSFSFGQTVFFSMNDTKDAGNRSSSSSAVPSLASDLKSTSSMSTSSPRSPETDSPSQSSIRSRGRALSDTVFQSILRSSSTSAHSNKLPEADINDESSSELVVYAAPLQPAPDPFSATANTYYGPQTMIPVTPPRGHHQTHVRKTSKEENIIVSLQTQLSIQAELFSQYETDLRARDEMVEILSRRLGESEKEETKRKGILRAWKKKVAELERACRFLEDEVETSRQEASERSIMDEASGEALRMLHRQIAGLEREKNDWSRKEEVLREEVQTLEELIRERSEDVQNLKQTLWNRDESQRELQDGLREAKEQIDQMGNISIAMVDEAEFKQTIAELEQREEEERERHHEVESKWEQQRAEMMLTTENAKAEKIALEGELETIKQQLKTREDEYTTLKAELEAQWSHTEKATEKIEALERENEELEAERHALEEANAKWDDERQTLNEEVQQLREHAQSLEAEREQLENERQSLYENVDHLEAELADAREEKDALVNKVDVLTDQLEQSKRNADHKHKIAEEFVTKHKDVERELQFALSEVERLKANNQKDEEDSQASLQRLKESEQTIGDLQARIASMTREHARMNRERASANEELERAAKEKAHLQELANQEATFRMDNERLSKDLERIRKELETLRKDSADKDLKIVQLNKQREADKDDISGLNIALDAKQQELELIKRKLAVAGTAGSTPASKVPGQRRESSIFSSRPSSVASEKDFALANPREKKLSSETLAKLDLTQSKDKKSSVADTPSKIAVGALSKSLRVNSAVSTPSSVTPKPRVGTMGPPARPSMGVSTPTPGVRSSLSRTASGSSSSILAKPRPTTPASTTSSTSSASTTASHHKKTSSGLDQSRRLPSAPKGAPASDKESGNTSEKEKENLSLSASRRRSILTTPA